MSASNAVALVALLLVVAILYSSPSFVWSATGQGNVSANVYYAPIACNSSLTVNGKLVSDLTCNGTALRIWADNVTLDCQHHNITSNRTGIAIHIIGKNVNITNCNVGRASIALKLGTDPINVIIENSTFEDSEYGIFIENSLNITIRNSTVRNNSIAGVLMNNTNSSFIHNTTFDRNRIGLDIISGTGNVVWYNNFLRSTNLQLAHANATAGNYFNTTVGGIARGNNWSGITGLAIYDSNGDGFGDSGDLPYSQAKGGFVLGSVEDWGPITTRTPPTAPTPPGGGPPVVHGPPACRENWTCIDWRPCAPDGRQARDCIDVSSCAAKLANGTVGRIISEAIPNRSQSCLYIPTCSNGYKDVSEIDTDCGGACAPCGIGKACIAGSGCASGFCKNGKCAKPPVEVPAPVPAPIFFPTIILALIALLATIALLLRRWAAHRHHFHRWWRRL